MRIHCRTIAAPLVIALVAACAVTAPPQPQRTYDHIAEPSRLYAAAIGVLESAGYAIAKREPARREVQTSWKEGGRERRMYTGWVETESLQDRYNVFLELRVQERPPAGGDWTDRPVVADQDAEYVRLLQALDVAVRQIGGIRY
jgi:uncharacterized lipoprotein